MERIILMPELEGDDSNPHKIWRRVFYSIVLTSLEFFLAIIALLAGIPVLLDPFSLTLVPNSIVLLMPLWMVDLWAAQIALGGGITILGIMRGDFRIEQIGVLLMLAGAFVYSFALITILPGSWVAFVTYSLFCCAMAARYWVLGRLIKLTRKLVQNAKRTREE
jgi:hypothetical protein